jgi:anti-anti-sigma regulatory factor/HAMP domain-containing protein
MEPTTPPPSVGDRTERRTVQRRTLAKAVLLKMAIRLSVVTVLLTALSYGHIVRSITAARERDLVDYIRARGERETELFQLAQDHHKVVAAALVERLRAMGDADPLEEFERRYKEFPDGVFRCRPEGFDPTREAQVFIDDGTPKTPETRRKAIAVQDTMTSFGRAMIIRFIDTWMVTPENININYWPSVPEWMSNTAASSDFTKEEFYTIGTPAENPSRKTVWTKEYIDPQAKICMVSAVTPVYDGDRFLGVIGHDIALQDLVRRTVEEKLAGAYNVLLRKDGHLIAHPTLAAAIEAAGGSFDVGQSGDPKLQALHRRATSVSDRVALVESEDGEDYLAVARVPGPDWYLVTVYPKSELQGIAYQSAKFVLFAGLIALLIELGLVYWILQRQVAAPLGAILTATKRVSEGDFSFRLEERRGDELGSLAASFMTMAGALRERSEAKDKALAEREETEERIRALNKELEQNLEGERERARALEQLNRAVEALGAPVLEVWTDVLALPIIGHLDEARASKMTEKLLNYVVRTRCRFVLLDITGVEVIDPQTVEQIVKMVGAVGLLGAGCVLTGARPSVARAMAELGVHFGSLTTRPSLKEGLLECIRRMDAADGRRSRR